MIIRSIRHRGLRRFVERDDPRQLPANFVRPIRNRMAALISAVDIYSVKGPPGWHIHPLGGDRAGGWGISLSGNWRLTFDLEHGEICNLDLEDYH
jgi:toxin HigB-1